MKRWLFAVLVLLALGAAWWTASLEFRPNEPGEMRYILVFAPHVTSALNFRQGSIFPVGSTPGSGHAKACGKLHRVKHAVLTSIGHNIADSLASGVGMLIGVYDMDVFGEAAGSPEGFIEVDFLSGTTTGARPSTSLARAIRLYTEALPALCERQGAKVSDFGRLVARYAAGSAGDHHFTVEVVDRLGKQSRDHYAGLPGARPKTLDALGRVRPIKSA